MSKLNLQRLPYSTPEGKKFRNDLRKRNQQKYHFVERDYAALERRIVAWANKQEGNNDILNQK